MPSNGICKPGDPEPRHIVSIRNAWKSHDNKYYVMKNLSLTVPQGTIYSILGSSGSGKSSILSCIVGNSKLDSGDIRVDLPNRLHLGYMPQDLALYEDLTLRETFKFFGSLCNMNESEIESRFCQLSTLLEIPQPNLLLKNMSGGEKRRSSLGVSLLYKPQLLVLDEPTVGLDSILRDKIWSYLQSITRAEGSTVIITTHYIEEARNSDMVCFLKEGSVLLEGRPEGLMKEYGTDSLEQIYFNLIHLDMERRSDSTVKPVPVAGQSACVRAFQHDEKWSFKRVLAFTTKSLMQIKRNPLMFYICMLLPGLLFVLMTEASRPPSLIRLGYINTESSCRDAIMNCSAPLSCRYLQRLSDKNRFITVEYGTISEGLEAVSRNQVWALLHFSANFTQEVTNRLDYFYSDDRKILTEQAAIWIDMSNYVISEMLKRGLEQSYLKTLETWYTDCGYNTRYVQPILKMEEGSERYEDEANSAIPGAVILILYTISMSVGLIFILTEKESGTYLRCKVLGLTSGEMLCSEFLSSMCVCLPPTVLLLSLLYLYSGQARTTLFSTLLLLFLQVTAAIINGLLIALMTRNLTLALLTSTGIATLSSYITGVMWPVEGMHWLCKILNKLLPVTVAVKSMAALANRSATILDTQVLEGFFNTFLWILIFLVFIRLIIARQYK